MIKTEKDNQIKKNTDVFTKDWKVVLFFGNRFSIGKKVQVAKLSSSKDHFVAFTTAAILSVDIEHDEFTMFNTGPCRYIGFDALRYAGRDLPMAFSEKHPIIHESLDISVVSLSTPNLNLVNTSIFVLKVHKLKQNLYHVFTETGEYFITVE